VPTVLWDDDEFKDNLETGVDVQGIVGQTDDFFFIKLMLASGVCDCGICDECDQDPLSVTLSAFTASVQNGRSMSINWATSSESNMRGYHVLRAEVALIQSQVDDLIAPDLVNAQRISQNLILATNTSTTQEYSLLDENVNRGVMYWYWLQSIGNDGTFEFYGPVNKGLDSGDIVPDLPLFTVMNSVYPNPVRGNANFDISVKEGETAVLHIFNIRGQLVREFRDIRTGNHNIVWNGRDNHEREVSSGIYFYRLTSPTVNDVRRMVLIK
jgi:hypothetical protein